MAGDGRISPGGDGFIAPGARQVFLRAAGPGAGSGTERRSRQDERFDRAQRFGGIGLWEWDVRSGALWWSAGVPPLFGAAAIETETSYARFLELVWPQDRAAVAAAVDICLEGKAPYDMEHRVQWPDGSVHWLREHGEVERDASGNPVRMLGVVKDVTEIVRARQAAEGLEEQKTQFIAAMGHDLRTSLNSILGFAQLLESDPEAPLRGEQLESVREILHAGERLRLVVERLLAQVTGLELDRQGPSSSS